MNTQKDIFKEELKNQGDQSLLIIKHIGISDYKVIEDSYSELNLPSPIKLIKNTWLTRYPETPLMNHGWGNGYVRIPEGHKFYGMDEIDISVVVHGGITFARHINDGDYDYLSDGFWIGFDTVHSGDTIENWPKEKVLNETIKLFKKIYGLS